MTTGDLYLPPISFANQKYFRDIWTGRKLYVKCSQVVVISIPQLEEIEVSSILKFTTEYFDILKFLPEYDYKKEPNRDWLWNLVNTLINENFQ